MSLSLLNRVSQKGPCTTGWEAWRLYVHPTGHAYYGYIYSRNNRISHQMEIYSALRYWPFGEGIHRSLVDFQGPVTRSFDVFLDQRLDERLRKQSRRRWFETPLRSLWRHCNEPSKLDLNSTLLVIARNIIWYQICATPHNVIKLMNSAMS